MMGIKSRIALLKIRLKVVANPRRFLCFENVRVDTSESSRYNLELGEDESKVDFGLDEADLRDETAHFPVLNLMKPIVTF